MKKQKYYAVYWKFGPRFQLVTFKPDKTKTKFSERDKSHVLISSYSFLSFPFTLRSLEDAKKKGLTVEVNNKKYHKFGLKLAA